MISTATLLLMLGPCSSLSIGIGICHTLGRFVLNKKSAAFMTEVSQSINSDILLLNIQAIPLLDFTRLLPLETGVDVRQERLGPGDILIDNTQDFLRETCVYRSGARLEGLATLRETIC